MSRGIKFGTLIFLCVASRVAAVTVDMQLVTGNVTNPIFITHAGDDSGRLFIVEQNGRIKIFDLTTTNLLATPFLNITNLTLFSGEQGLLSVAFHPGYKTNGFLYVYMTNTNGSSNVVVRFTASPPSANTVLTNTLQTVLRISHPGQSNHNGGQLQFGPDGYLYIGTGDGGGGCDSPNNAQNLGSLLGKLLRIDVNTNVSYQIPSSNPFVGVAGLDEIWAYGLRNPWRFSFDRLTGDLWIGDVGQGPSNPHEEVDFRPVSSTGGENYGWRLYEGFGTNTCSVTFSNVPTVLPILDYDHSSGRCAVMGGYRYRGTKIPPLYGTYLYADECGGQIYGIFTNSIGAWVNTFTNNTGFTVTTFGEDQDGEMYFSRYATGGSIYRIAWKDTDGDGLADDWEQQFFGNPTNANASADNDGDGFTNLQELLASTDPTNSASALRVGSIVPFGGGFQFEFASASNEFYRLERNDDLTTGTWTTVSNNIAGTGGVLPLVDDSPNMTQQFYRVRLLP